MKIENVEGYLHTILQLYISPKHQDYNDYFQEVYLKYLTLLPIPPSIVNESSYIGRCIKNRIIDLLRISNRYKHHYILTDDLDSYCE